MSEAEEEFHRLCCEEVDAWLEQRLLYRQLVAEGRHAGVPVPQPPPDRTRMRADAEVNYWATSLKRDGRLMRLGIDVGVPKLTRNAAPLKALTKIAAKDADVARALNAVVKARMRSGRTLRH